MAKTIGSALRIRRCLLPIRHTPAAMNIEVKGHCDLRFNGRLEVWAAVWIVIVVGAAEFPGVTVAGLKVNVAPGGSPVGDKVTTPLNAPPTGDTVRLTLTELPAATVTGVCGAVTVKVGAVEMVTVSGSEVDSAESAFPE